MERLTNHAVRVANVLTGVFGRFGLRAKWPSNCQERCRLPAAVVGAARGNDLGRRDLMTVPFSGMSWILRGRGEICGDGSAGQASTLSQSRTATAAGQNYESCKQGDARRLHLLTLQTENREKGSQPMRSADGIDKPGIHSSWLTVG